jgi:hypothetical protein
MSTLFLSELERGVQFCVKRLYVVFRRQSIIYSDAKTRIAPFRSVFAQQIYSGHGWVWYDFAAKVSHTSQMLSIFQEYMIFYLIRK